MTMHIECAAEAVARAEAQFEGEKADRYAIESYADDETISKLSTHSITRKPKASLPPSASHARAVMPRSPVSSAGPSPQHCLKPTVAPAQSTPLLASLKRIHGQRG